MCWRMTLLYDVDSKALRKLGTCLLCWSFLLSNDNTAFRLGKFCLFINDSHLFLFTDSIVISKSLHGPSSSYGDGNKYRWRLKGWSHLRWFWRCYNVSLGMIQFRPSVRVRSSAGCFGMDDALHTDSCSLDQPNLFYLLDRHGTREKVVYWATVHWLWYWIN